MGEREIEGEKEGKGMFMGGQQKKNNLFLSRHSIQSAHTNINKPPTLTAGVQRLYGWTFLSGSNSSRVNGTI